MDNVLSFMRIRNSFAFYALIVFVVNSFQCSIFHENSQPNTER